MGEKNWPKSAKKSQNSFSGLGRPCLRAGLKAQPQARRGAGPKGPHLRRACGWPFGPARRQGRLSPENEYWLFLALFGQFFSAIFFLSQIVISPYTNIF